MKKLCSFLLAVLLMVGVCAVPALAADVPAPGVVLEETYSDDAALFRVETDSAAVFSNFCKQDLLRLRLRIAERTTLPVIDNTNMTVRVLHRIRIGNILPLIDHEAPPKASPFILRQHGFQMG